MQDLEPHPLTTPTNRRQRTRPTKVSLADATSVGLASDSPFFLQGTCSASFPDVIGVPPCNGVLINYLSEIGSNSVLLTHGILYQNSLKF